MAADLSKWYYPIQVTFCNGAIRHYFSDTLKIWMNDPKAQEIIREDTGDILKSIE